MENNYFNQFMNPGVFFGGVLLQASAKIGGAKSVFVDIEGVKNELTMPSWGGQIKNPFKGNAKFYAGDLFELRFDDKGESPELYLLKTFKVKSQSSTTINIYRDGYSHIPFVGDVLMKAPETIGGQGGQASKVTAVVATDEGGTDVWAVTVDTEIASLVDGDILVEAKETDQTANGNMLVKTINAVAPCDGDFVYMPTTGATNDASSVRMYYTPVMHGTMYIHKMSPMPKCVLDLNKSRFNGWYEV